MARRTASHWAFLLGRAARAASASPRSCRGFRREAEGRGLGRRRSLSARRGTLTFDARQPLRPWRPRAGGNVDLGFLPGAAQSSAGTSASFRQHFVRPIGVFAGTMKVEGGASSSSERRRHRGSGRHLVGARCRRCVLQRVSVGCAHGRTRLVTLLHDHLGGAGAALGRAADLCARPHRRPIVARPIATLQFPPDGRPHREPRRGASAKSCRIALSGAVTGAFSCTARRCFDSRPTWEGLGWWSSAPSPLSSITSVSCNLAGRPAHTWTNSDSGARGP